MQRSRTGATSQVLHIHFQLKLNDTLPSHKPSLITEHMYMISWSAHFCSLWLSSGILSLLTCVQVLAVLFTNNSAVSLPNEAEWAVTATSVPQTLCFSTVIILSRFLLTFSPSLPCLISPHKSFLFSFLSLSGYFSYQLLSHSFFLFLQVLSFACPFNSSSYCILP